jgi:hypothetical protein
MLTADLDKIWQAASSEERNAAVIRAKRILENLVYYPARKNSKDDVQFLAASLLSERSSDA